MFKTLQNIWRVEDLRKRILFTLFVLIIFRIGSFVPVPGVNKDVFTQANQAGNELFGLLNTFSGARYRSFRSSPFRYSHILQRPLSCSYCRWTSFRSSRSGTNKGNMVKSSWLRLLVMVRYYWVSSRPSRCPSGLTGCTAWIWCQEQPLLISL